MQVEIPIRQTVDRAESEVRLWRSVDARHLDHRNRRDAVFRREVVPRVGMSLIWGVYERQRYVKVGRTKKKRWCDANNALGVSERRQLSARDRKPEHRRGNRCIAPTTRSTRFNASVTLSVLGATAHRILHLASHGTDGLHSDSGKPLTHRAKRTPDRQTNKYELRTPDYLHALLALAVCRAPCLRALFLVVVVRTTLALQVIVCQLTVRPTVGQLFNLSDEMKRGEQKSHGKLQAGGRNCR